MSDHSVLERYAGTTELQYRSVHLVQNVHCDRRKVTGCSQLSPPPPTHTQKEHINWSRGKGRLTSLLLPRTGPPPLPPPQVSLPYTRTD
jgi:hypothetical protein